MEQTLNRGQQWLEKVLALMGTPTTVKLSKPETTKEMTIGETTSWLVIDESELSEEQARALLKDQGETIDSLQYLANTLLNLGVAPEEQTPLTIEFKGYREQREKELRVLAEKTAWQVLETGETVELKSLSGAERRQIHHFLKQYDGLESLSRGQEPDRYLVVQRKSN